MGIFEKWDFNFHSESRGASIYSAWEFAIASHLHETQIKGLAARRGFAYTGIGEHFFNR
jgi:hypothetical protein